MRYPGGARYPGGFLHITQKNELNPSCISSGTFNVHFFFKVSLPWGKNNKNKVSATAFGDKDLSFSVVFLKIPWLGGACGGRRRIRKSKVRRRPGGTNHSFFDFCTVSVDWGSLGGREEQNNDGFGDGLGEQKH